MIADSHFRMTPDLKKNNGWPICLVHRNPEAPFCPIMSRLVLELWMCYHLFFLCYMKQRYQILNKTPPLSIVSSPLHKGEMETSLLHAAFLLTLFSLQKKPSISTQRRHFFNELWLAWDYLMGDGDFHYRVGHLNPGQLRRGWSALVFVSCMK